MLFLKRIFLYVRVSTEEQAIHGLSIGAQTAALEEWAKANHHEVVGTYTDAGISARKPASKRPELQRLLNDIRAGKGELVVFTKLDRWFRNISEYYKVQEVLERHHVDWRTIHEDYDTSTASGRLKINIMLSVAQDEADRTSERIKAVFEAKRRKLEPLTGDCPTGYKQENKKYVKDPKTEPAVSAFFQRFLESGSISAAQQSAQEHGLLINYQLAHKMLNRTCYYGRYFNIDGMTPPYITKEEFEKIQSMRHKVVRKTKKNRVYIFSGLVVCGECGGRMGGRVNTNQASFFYNCTSHYMKYSGCTNTSNMLEKKIEALLIETIDGRMQELKLQLGEIHEERKRRNYSAEISSLRTKVGRLKDLYLNELITLEDYKADFSRYNAQIEQLEQESKKTKKPDISAIKSLLDRDWKNLYREMIREKQRDFWKIALKEIRIYKDRHIEYDFNAIY